MFCVLAGGMTAKLCVQGDAPSLFPSTKSTRCRYKQPGCLSHCVEDTTQEGYELTLNFSRGRNKLCEANEA